MTLAAGAEKARAIAAPVLADVRDRMGIGRGGLVFSEWPSPTSTSSSTSSPGRSTC